MIQKQCSGLIIIGLTILFLPLKLSSQNDKTATYEYTSNWESLSHHIQAPEWLKDAKFGVYYNWGVYNVPEKFSEWYPRSMYEKDNPAFEYHRKTYGDQSEFGYHDFIPMFKGSKFNAREWAFLAKDAGAKFGGMVAEHHDGFSMWDSHVTPWNAKEMGPKKDILGSLQHEMEQVGLKFIATFHHARNLQRNKGPNNDGNYDSHFIYNKDWHTSSTDPKLSLLYGNISEEKFDKIWFEKLKEVIDGYSPDIIYFDSWLNLIPERQRQKFCSYYLNSAARKHQEVAIIYKQFDLPLSVGINDIEKGGHMEVFKPVWMTDDTINFGSWSYTDNSKVKPTSMVLHSLIDIVSKNGVLLLDIAPRADGSIPKEQKSILREMGKWLESNGEAIYNTRPWLIHGGGPTGPKTGEHGGMATTNAYTADDYRFTQSKDGKTIYVTILGSPEPEKRIFIRELAPHRYPIASPVKKVTELQTGVETTFEEYDNGSFLVVPNIKLNDLAVVFKIDLK